MVVLNLCSNPVYQNRFLEPDLATLYPPKMTSPPNITITNGSRLLSSPSATLANSRSNLMLFWLSSDTDTSLGSIVTSNHCTAPSNPS